MAEVAETVLERAIVAVQRRALDCPAMLWTFVASTLYIASAVEPAAGDLGGVQPLVAQRDGRDLLAVFTTPGRTAGFASTHPLVVAQDGLLLLRSSPKDVGVVVNPGGEIGFEMQSDGIARFLSEILAG